VNRWIAALALAALAQAACYRTHYERFSAVRAEELRSVPVAVTGWQHFYLYGWVPGERVVDARKRCGGADKIVAIETRRSFLEGLVAAFAGYYVNIYSPYDGAVLCTEQPPEDA
jgi:hypothetical protein